MKHKVFISYHHENDQKRADYLRDTYGKEYSIFSDASLDNAFPDKWNNDKILAGIRQNYIGKATVTIVLIGSETAKRKWIDWEINASLRPYGDRTRNGLLAIYLPDAGDVPARLQDNLNSGYAVSMKWEYISWQLESKIEDAYNNREKAKLIKNDRPVRLKNS